MPSIEIDTEKCNQCGICAEVCPADIIQLEILQQPPHWIEDGEVLCINCGHCVAVCPTAAVSLDTVQPEDCHRVRRELLPSSEQIEHFLKSRRSIRVYRPDPVERELLTKIIDIARYAPTGHNAQLVQWLVIEDAAEVRRLAGLTVDWLRWMTREMSDIAELMQAPHLIARWESGSDVITRGAPHLVFAHEYKDMGLLGDCQIALAHLELSAHSFGLGACWAGYVQLAASSYPPMMEALQLPEGNQSFGAMMIGYPEHRYLRIPRRNEPSITWR